MSSCNYKIVRHLLINGASRNYKDNNGKIPFDIASSDENHELVDILVIYKQKSSTCLQKLNPFKPPLQPVTKSHKLFILYVLCLLLRYATVFLFLLPRIEFPFVLVSFALFLLTFSTFLITSFKNPGYIVSKTDPLQMYEKYKPEYICPYCLCVKLKTTRHCQHCKRCVDVRII